MSEATITLNAQTSASGNGINKYEMLQSLSEDVRQKYNEVFENVQDSLTIVADNDAFQKIKVAIVEFTATDAQSKVLLNIADAFKAIECTIDPERLQFTTAKAIDDEICLNRITSIGLSKLIINEDGVTIFSFIAYKGSTAPDEFDVFEEDTTIDYEQLAYKFFSL